MDACWTGTLDARTPQDLVCDTLDARERVLPASELLVVEHAYGRVVECRGGWVWITQENDARDVVLGAGQQFRFDRLGKAVVQSLERARVVLY